MLKIELEYIHTCTRVKERGGKVSFPPLKKILENLSPPVRGLSPPLFFSPHFEFWAYFPPPVWVLASKSTRKTSKFTKKRGGKIFLPPKNSWKIFPRGKFSPPVRPPTCACMEGVDILRLHEHVKSAFQRRYRSSTASRTLCYARSYMIIVTTLRIFLISERDISFDSFDQVGVPEGQ